MKMYADVSKAIGNTPLVRLARFSAARGIKAVLLAKVEGVNPTGSAKDRAAESMLRDAEARGLLKSGGTVVEPTSGNTGVALAALCAARGYRAILTMPDTMSKERRALLSAYGAECVLTEGALGMRGAIARAEALVAEIPGAFMPAQFDNLANARAHYETTGPEIWRDTDGDLAAFVATVGSGGTITGTGRYLKEMNPNLRVIAVEPARSPVLSGGKPGVHGIQGIGAGFVPGVLDTTVYDEVLAVSDEDAMQTTRALAREEGILAGISSGAALYAAANVARRAEYAGKNIVVLLPDSGDRYTSSGIYD